MNRGKLITFEGIDGAGKSSHISCLSEFLEKNGKSVVRTREPGGTALGEKLRACLLHDAMHVETEALLMFAARREHLAQVVEPALARGDWVLCDRFDDASYAYQGGGRGLSWHKIAQLEHWVRSDELGEVRAHTQADLTLLFDLPSSVAEQRIQTQARVLDRFEQEHSIFHQRVRAAYLERARIEPQRIHIIDADQPLPVIKKTLRDCLIKLFNLVDYEHN
ncbi:MAG: dTMP kinase [Pseudomonadota bacterium]